jgi:hypothetical protein
VNRLGVEKGGGKFLGGRIPVVRLQFQSPQSRDDAEMSNIVFEEGVIEIGHGRGIKVNR